MEGCYLHTAIVMTYSTDKLRKWVFLFIGWCKSQPHLADAAARLRAPLACGAFKGKRRRHHITQPYPVGIRVISPGSPQCQPLPVTKAHRRKDDQKLMSPSSQHDRVFESHGGTWPGLQMKHRRELSCRPGKRAAFILPK